MALSTNAIDALEAAVRKAPDNIALRVHLAGVLLDAGRVEDAAAECDFVLSTDPRHPTALVLAERAARLLGDATRADALHDRRSAAADRDDVDERPQPRRFRRRPSRF